MPDRALDLSTCPECDLDPTFAMKTTDAAMLTTQNLMSQGTVRACVAPTTMEVDDHKQPALFIIFHKVEDAGFVTANNLDPNEDDPDASEPDLSTLTDFERRVVEYVKREQPVLAGIQGKFADTGRSPAEIKAAVNSLVNEGFLEEDGGAYAFAGGG